MKNIFVKASQKKNVDNTPRASLKSANPLKGLRDLFETELKDIFWSEKALIKAFSKMITNAESPELINAISDHLDLTIRHVARLEKTFSIMCIKPIPKKCDLMEGMILSLEQTINKLEEGIVRDAGILSAARKIEHFEIAAYSTLLAFATTLGQSEVAGILKQTLDEENEADDILTSIARASINPQTSYEYMIYRTTERRTA